MQFDRAPRMEVEDTDFGFHYAALREVEGSAERMLARVTAFIAPFTVLNPNGDIATMVVPKSDESCAFYHVFWDRNRRVGEEPPRSEHLKLLRRYPTTAAR